MGEAVDLVLFTVSVTFIIDKNLLCDDCRCSGARFFYVRSISVVVPLSLMSCGAIFRPDIVTSISEFRLVSFLHDLYHIFQKLVSTGTAKTILNHV